MTVINWNDFEFLLGVAHGLDHKGGNAVKETDSNALQNLLAKRERLDQQKKRFREASEENILKEYESLRRAHREFMHSFQEAHEAYYVPQKETVSQS